MRAALVSLTILVLTTFLISTGESANILFYFGLSTYSHRITAWPFVEALAERGHSVTFLQPDPNKNPNPKIKEIVPNMSGHLSGEDKVDTLALRTSLGPHGGMVITFQLPLMGRLICEDLLDNPEMIAWINTTKYDLVVVDALYNDCGYGIAYKFGAQTAVFATTSVFDWWPDTYGFPAESNVYPNLLYGLDQPLSFLSRVVSTLGHLYFRFTKVGYLHPRIEPLLKEKLNIPDMPSLAALESNVSLILMNTHFSEESARALPPLIVPVGGMHCTEKTEPLPKDIESFLGQSGNDGFIYVSFGSTAQIIKGPVELKDLFFNTFKKMSKLRFLWKWEGPRPADMPSNVLTVNWVPQQAVLAHPKIKAFITHGGLLSMQESIFNSVPMISFPLFAEQDYNSERLHRTKRGIRLEISSLTQPELEDAINKILNDDTYAKNVKTASIVFKDRPEKPIDTAVWWVEYILRHKETNFLRPLAISQTWYQRRLLDVWAFIAAVVGFVIWLNVFILRKLLSCCFTKSSDLKSVTQAKNSKVKKN